MEIEIQSKTNNPLLKRTEVHFVIHHASEGTPKRELVRSELAEKMNVKKETVMVNFMKSSFGSNETVGYAKVYKSVEKAKAGEKDHILVRNAVIAPKKLAKEKKKKPAEKPGEKAEPKEEVAEKVEDEEEPAEEKPEQKEETTEQSKEEEKPAMEKKEESTEKTESVEKAAEEKAELKEEVAEKSKEEEKSAEEKKE